jgi:FkbM family methyltransferase
MSSSHHNFKNSILIVVFNYSYLIHDNKPVIKKLYEKHFKQLIFYADYPIDNDDEVNFIPINYGYNAHKIFNHFYEKYKSTIDASDGVFYTMDDNIINVNILNLFDSSKLIYYYIEVKPVDAHTGWWWDSNCDGKYGKHAIHRLMQDDEFKKCDINAFSGHGAAGDWFYLPKKYLTPALFHLFDLFSKHEVFLEIAIPSVINNMEKDKSQYQQFTDEILWGDRDKFSNNEYLYKSLNHRHHFILHPIKFKENPRAVEWLNDIFHKEKCVIITTINAPTETILKHIKNEEYDVIIVGDHKTPSEHYANLKCIYLDIPSQKKLFPELSELLPYNHYCRKNLGYLYAIKKGYKIIYETDDDNVPHDNFDRVLQCNDGLQMITEQNNAWINIFKYFTNNGYIWPRGFPLSLLKHNPNYLIQPTDKTPSIINGLVENDPDVDALFRIICNHQHCIQWEKNKRIMINNRNVCVFNSQNTFWLNPEVFMCLLIPCSVSFRYCDILRGIISNAILKKTNNYMMYSSPNVTQYRNEHDLMSDFKSEYEMYIHNENILNFIENKKYLYLIQSASKLPDIYKCLKNCVHRDVVLLSYKESTSDTSIFYPGSTWTTGRNRLREYGLNLKKKYDYYIFLDDDVSFAYCSQEDGFTIFEGLLTKYNPFIANPNYDGYYLTYGIIPSVEAHTTIWFDGMFNAFSKEAFFSNQIFPYIHKFDDNSWWMSQYAMIILCSVYDKEVLLFPGLKINNVNHSEYPKNDGWKETEDFIFNNVISISQLDAIHDITSQSIFKIAEFLNVVLRKFQKINCIDVGCAIGDFRNLITHANVFSIGIDPLIEQYKHWHNHLNKFTILHNVAIDNESGKKMFNITNSRDTSSLFEFNTELTTSECNLTHFYIPPSVIHQITTIIEQKEVETQPLKTIIEKDLKNEIIHILKIDAQGNDLNVIKSAGNLLTNVMFIVMESNSDTTTTLYKNSTHFAEDCSYLKSRDFELITKETLLRDDMDCLYYNTKLIINDVVWDSKPLKEVSVNTSDDDKLNVKSALMSIYDNLLANDVIAQKDMDLLHKWSSYF